MCPCNCSKIAIRFYSCNSIINLFQNLNLYLCNMSCNPQAIFIIHACVNKTWGGGVALLLECLLTVPRILGSNSKLGLVKMTCKVLWTHSLSRYIWYSHVVINNHNLQINLRCSLWREIQKNPDVSAWPCNLKERLFILNPLLNWSLRVMGHTIVYRCQQKNGSYISCLSNALQ
jgi:hypothetical protein